MGQGVGSGGWLRSLFGHHLLAVPEGVEQSQGLGSLGSLGRCDAWSGGCIGFLI